MPIPFQLANVHALLHATTFKEDRVFLTVGKPGQTPRDLDVTYEEYRAMLGGEGTLGPPTFKKIPPEYKPMIATMGMAEVLERHGVDVPIRKIVYHAEETEYLLDEPGPDGIESIRIPSSMENPRP